jgi:hypothetical protein
MSNEAVQDMEAMGRNERTAQNAFARARVAQLPVRRSSEQIHILKLK